MTSSANSPTHPEAEATATFVSPTGWQDPASGAAARSDGNRCDIARCPISQPRQRDPRADHVRRIDAYPRVVHQAGQRETDAQRGAYVAKHIAGTHTNFAPALKPISGQRDH